MGNQNKKQARPIALKYLKAWTSKDFEKAADCLSENITFETPINSYAGKQTWMEAVKFTGIAASGVKLLAEFSNEDEAMLLYDMVLNPIGNLRIAEHFKISNGKIKMIRQVHDTAELRKAGFDKNNS